MVKGLSLSLSVQKKKKKKNVTKTYKKTNKNTPDLITSIDKETAQNLTLDDRIEVYASRDIRHIKRSQA